MPDQDGRTDPSDHASEAPTMSIAAAIKSDSHDRKSAVEIVRELGPVFAARAAEAADEDKFVAENIAELKSAGLVEAGVPAELGGGGADIDELAAMLRMLGYHCGSTALTFSMHTHQVADTGLALDVPERQAAVEPLLKRIAAERHPAAVERRFGLDRRLRQG